MKLIFIMLTTVLSCSTVSEEKKMLAWKQWQGHSVKTLSTHPYFEHLPLFKIKHNDAPDTWIFRDQSRFQSDSYCQSLSGCVGMAIYNCDNVFSIKDNVILGFEQNGTCPGIKAIEAPNKSVK